MAVPSVIRDLFTGNSASVTNERALKTTLSYSLPEEDDILCVPYSERLSVDGEGVITNLNVTGSLSSPVRAFVKSQTDGDFYVTTANISITDNTALQLNRFGALSRLTNGVQFFYAIPRGERILGSVKSNYEMIRLGTLTQPIGTKTDAYQISAIDSSNNDGYNPVLDLTRFSPFGLGIKLNQNRNDSLGIIIQDDLSGLVTFDIILTGYIRLRD